MPHQEISWSIVKPKPSWNQSLKWRIPFISLLLLSLLTASHQISSRSGPGVYIDLMILLTALSIATTATTWLIMSLIYKHTKDKVVDFKITEAYLVVANKKVLLKDLNKDSINQALKQQELEYNQWATTQTSLKDLSTNINSNQGLLRLLYPNELTRQKALRSLKDFINTGN